MIKHINEKLGRQYDDTSSITVTDDVKKIFTDLLSEKSECSYNTYLVTKLPNDTKICVPGLVYDCPQKNVGAKYAVHVKCALCYNILNMRSIYSYWSSQSIYKKN